MDLDADYCTSVSVALSQVVRGHPRGLPRGLTARLPINYVAVYVTDWTWIGERFVAGAPALNSWNLISECTSASS